jgi:hypothetical protein
MNRKEEVLEATKNILYRTPQGFPVKAGDFQYLMDIVFPLHPKWREINNKGIKLAMVRVNQYGSRYFSVLLMDNTFENISIYECINRKGLKEDIVAAAKNAVVDITLPPLEGRKKKRPEFSIVVKNWTDTIDGEELAIGRYIIEMPNGEKFFDNQDIIDSFRNYYITNG